MILRTVHIPISDEDESSIYLESRPDPIGDTKGFLCLKLKHKGKYRSVLLEPGHVAELVEQLVNVSTEKWGGVFEAELQQRLKRRVLDD